MTDKNFIKIEKINEPKGYHKDLYHKLLKVSWLNLFITYVLFFISLNLLFAALYMVSPGSLSIAPLTLKHAFFFSVQTFSTVGYGAISPVSVYGNTIVVIEIMIGLISTAVSTGLVFARFSKPSARIMYSKNILFTHYNNQPVLMFRMANSRSNEIISASVELHYTYPEVSSEGIKMIRFAGLKLERNYSPLFSLSWTIIHVINNESPFYQKSFEEIKKTNSEFFVIFNGTDGTRSQTIHDFYSYSTDNLLNEQYFVDIISKKDDGTRLIDYQFFHSTVKRPKHE